eukprot:COSAG06_NODE_1444_length_9453_cov_2.850438_4_plen_68_part_00
MQLLSWPAGLQAAAAPAAPRKSKTREGPGPWVMMVSHAERRAAARHFAAKPAAALVRLTPQCTFLLV